MAHGAEGRFAVTVASVFVARDGSNRQHAEYVVQVEYTGLMWRLRRRFREFDTLDRRLRPLGVTAPLPSKISFGRNKLSSGFLEERRRGLEAFLGAVCTPASSTRPAPPWKLPPLDRFLEFSSHTMAMTLQQVVSVPDGAAVLALLREEGVVAAPEPPRRSRRASSVATDDAAASLVGDNLFDTWAREEEEDAVAAASGAQAAGGSQVGDSWRAARALETSEALLREACEALQTRASSLRDFRSALRSKEDAFGTMLGAIQSEVLDARARMSRALERRDEARVSARRVAQADADTAAAALGRQMELECTVRSLARSCKDLASLYAAERGAEGGAADAMRGAGITWDDGEDASGRRPSGGSAPGAEEAATLGADEEAGMGASGAAASAGHASLWATSAGSPITSDHLMRGMADTAMAGRDATTCWSHESARLRGKDLEGALLLDAICRGPVR